MKLWIYLCYLTTDYRRVYQVVIGGIIPSFSLGIFIINFKRDRKVRPGWSSRLIITWNREGSLVPAPSHSSYTLRGC